MNNGRVTEEIMMNRFAQPLAWIDGQQDHMTELLKCWASINTGTYNIAGLAAFSGQLMPLLAELSGEPEIISLPPHALIDDRGQAESRPLGQAISLRSPACGGSKGPKILLAIHMDSVFAADHPFQAVTALPDGILRGPGVCDAKGGLAVMLFALLALKRSRFADALTWEVLLNPDEEIGSPGSASLFAAAARRNDVGLLFEPALPDGSLVSSRKGSGIFTLVVHGRTAHAGRESHLGRNAIHALAELIYKVTGAEEDCRGVIVNAGWVGGGGPVNIVPDLALCRINVRVDNAAQQRDFERYLQYRLREASRADGISVECHGGFHSPPKLLTPAIERMLNGLRECAAALDLRLAWRSTGGTCDGNRLAAAGLPNVDSLGVRGGSMHTDQEFMHVESLRERTRLTALFLMRAAAGEITVERRSEDQQVVRS